VQQIQELIWYVNGAMRLSVPLPCLHLNLKCVKLPLRHFSLHPDLSLNLVGVSLS
jgi:hypothetical protein